MPYPLTESDGKFCVNGKCYDNRADAEAYQKALYANVPDASKEGHFADPKDNKLPIGTPQEVADAITALSSGDFRGHKVQFDEGTKKAAVSAISKRIGELNILDDEKSHLRDRLSAVKELHLTPKSAGVFNRGKTGVTVLKGRDGLRYMLMITSNAYKDREHETIAAKALQEYVDSAWRVEGKCVPNNPLLFWHKSDEIGDIVWTKMQGPFLLEVAKERPNKKIRIKANKYIWETTIKTLWDVIENDDRYKWGASHGYRFIDSEFKDGIYQKIRKFESSTLPLPAAANLLTFSGVVKEMDTDKVLEDLFSRAGLLNSPEIVKRFLKGADELKKAADKAGLESKAFEDKKTKGILDKLGDKIDGLISQIFDEAPPDLKSQLLQAVVSVLATEEPDEVNPQGDTMSTAYDAAPPSATSEMTGKQMKVWETMLKGFEALLDDSQANKESATQTKEAVNQIVKALEPLAELPKTVKALDTRVENFDARLAAVEKRLSGAPRRAAEDVATVVKDEALTAAAKAALADMEEFLPGIKIMKTPANGKGGQ